MTGSATLERGVVKSNAARTADGAEQGKHLPELDGIRTIAIWLVLLTHLLNSPPSPPDFRAVPGGIVRVLVAHGWLGVDLFFVLSGFLITGILYRMKGVGRGAYFKQFYARRAARILPVYFIVLAVLVIAYGARYSWYFLLCALMSANLASLFHVDLPSGAGPYWSLAVEEQFYLIWPWFVLLLVPRWLGVLAAAILIAEPVVRFFAPGNLVLTWYHVDGLAMGALIAAWAHGWDGTPRSAVRFIAILLAGAAGVTLLSIAGVPGFEFAFRISQANCLFGALVVASVAFSGAPWLAVLRTRFMIATAALSYCLYLIHRPLLDAFNALAGRVPALAALAPVPGTYVRAAIVVLCAYALAALSRRFIEVPFLRLQRSWATRAAR